MSARASLAALDGVTTADGVATGSPPEAGAAGGAAGRVLPAPAELATVLPWPGLRRGSTVAVHGSVALLFALLSRATEDGSWAAVVGLPGIGVVAAAEAGVEVSRLALVPHPGDQPQSVVAALLDGVDLVVAGGAWADADARRLSARARHRGAVLLPFGSWPGADVELRCSGSRWHGLGRGHGHLREREITVRAEGRGAASRPRSCRLLLPARGGSAAAVQQRPALRSVVG